MAETLDDETLRARRPVWKALPDLFLDTEVRWDLPFVARVCATSPYSHDELDQVFWVEVFPLAIGNLLQVAGAWASLELDESQLVHRALHGTRPRLGKRLVGSLVQAEWTAVLALVTRLRGEPTERWPAMLQVWAAVLRRFFEDPRQPLVLPLEPKLEPLRSAGFPLAAEWAWFEPLARSMLTGDEAKEADARAAQVRATLGLDGAPQ